MSYQILRQFVIGGRVGEIDLLPQLYGQVLIPQAVQQELADERSPAIVQAWISQPPEWLVI